MKLDRDLKELIKRKLRKVNEVDNSKKQKTILSALKPYSIRVNKLKEEASKKAKALGASSISWYDNNKHYVYFNDNEKIDVDEEYYKIIEEITTSDEPQLSEIFKRIEAMGK